MISGDSNIRCLKSVQSQKSTSNIITYYTTTTHQRLASLVCDEREESERVYICSSKEFRNVPPHVELSIERVIHEMNVDVLLHHRRRSVHFVEGTEEFGMGRSVRNVNCR